MASEGWGGAESVFVDLANELAKAHKVFALLLRETLYEDRFSSKVERLTLQSNPTRYNPFLIYEIYRCLKDIKPQIIHTHAVKGTELVASANRLIKIPHLATKHNVRRGEIFNKLDWVTTVSESSCKTVGLKERGIVKVIYNGIHPEKIENITKFDIFTILAIGRLDKIKGFDILINQIRDLTFDFKLMIIGDGPERRNLETIISKLGLDEKVQLAGFREDIASLMKKAHLVVISSFSEGFSKVMVEGLFYADAVVSTPVGVAKEILPDMFLTEQENMGKKICEFYYEVDRFTEEFHKISKENSNRFLISSIVDQYTELYREMISPR